MNISSATARTLKTTLSSQFKSFEDEHSKRINRQHQPFLSTNKIIRIQKSNSYKAKILENKKNSLKTLFIIGYFFELLEILLRNCQDILVDFLFK